MTGTVISVDSGTMTVVIGMTADLDGSGNIMVNNTANIDVTLNNTMGFYGMPSVGADCIVVDADGTWELLKASKYDGIVMNGGALGGLVILEKIVDNLNAIHDYIFNTLQPAIESAFTAVGEGSAASGSAGETSFSTSVAGKDISFEDMENTKIKQG